MTDIDEIKLIIKLIQIIEIEMNKINTQIDLAKFGKIVPSSNENIRRLKYLKEEAGDPRIAVFGKYNHGKSTLLNALIGEDVFKTADKRETIKNAEYKDKNIIWVDTPGLDADVHGNDDKEAMAGAFKTADFLFLVHNVQAGELDKYEMKLYRQLMRQDKNYRKKMFLILTQIDQVSPEILNQVKIKIKTQLPDLKIISVSAIRYMRGIKENKEKFVERSGISEVFNLTGELTSDLEKLRQLEIKRLINKVQVELSQRRADVSNQLKSINHQINSNQTTFYNDLYLYLKKVREKVS